MQEIIYRLMSEGDIKQVAAIEKEIFSLPWSEKSFLDSLKNENTVYIVAEIKDEIVAYCGAYISFEEAAKGCKQTITFQHVENCEECSGSGAKKGTSATTCSNCGGSGQVRVNQRTPFGVVQTARTCDKCHGKGKIIEQPCKECNGTGHVRKKKTLEINIPAGIANEQMLKVSGQGNAGTNGGPAGDLLLVVNVRPHPIFTRKGNDVWCEIPLTFTLDGDVSYSVHEGTQPGDVFKLKGKGIEKLGGRGRGDQFVKVTIEVPKNLSKEQKEILQSFESTANEKNYAKRKSFFDKIKDKFD